MVAICVAVAATVLSAPVAPYPLWAWIPAQLAGLSFTVSGVLLWLRRPDVAVGRLMTAEGICWYFGTLQLSGNPVLFALGFCLFHLGNVVIAHLVLTVPTGRLSTFAERLTIATLYVVAPSTQIARYIAEYPPQPQSWGDPTAEYSVWAPIGSVLLLVLTMLVCVLVFRRWATAPRPVRREYAIVWAAILQLGAVIIASAVAALLHLPLAIQPVLYLAYAVSLVGLPVGIAAGMLRTRLVQRRVADLVLQLSAGLSPEQVRDALRHALDDPTLQVCAPPAPGQPDPAGRQTTLVERNGVPLAAVVHDPALLVQRPLLDAVLSATALALDNARLEDVRRHQLAEVRASRSRLLVAGDEQRRKIQRDLHDGVQHRLLSIAMLVERSRPAPGQLDGDSPGTDPLSVVAAELRTAIGELRALSEGIHPPVLTELGLRAAVDAVAERAPLPVLVGIAPDRWPEPLERAAYYVIVEALSNVYKHARASHARVRVTTDRSRLVVEVVDDGVGGARIGPGTGLPGLRDRADALGGMLTVDSAAGAGTRIIVELPCAS
jgi:signal transduction histidine kinase